MSLLICKVIGQLYVQSYFKCVGRGGPGETAWMPRLVWAFVAHMCNGLEPFEQLSKRTI